MADKRMFAKTIIDSDAFLDMPHTSQLLYFHLSMRGDDDGFINNPKSIARNVKCSDDDLKILAAKKFIIPFESGVIVIKHWKIHNYIAKDRYNETKYKNEKSMLTLDENKSYRLENQNNSYTDCIQDVDKVYTQVRLDKIKNNINTLNTATSEVEENGNVNNSQVYINFYTRDNKEFRLFTNDIVSYRNTYPLIDINQEIVKIKRWLIDNPKKNKTLSGYSRFINGWLNRQNEQAKEQKEKNENNKFNYQTSSKPNGYFEYKEYSLE